MSNRYPLFAGGELLDLDFFGNYISGSSQY